MIVWVMLASAAALAAVGLWLHAQSKRLQTEREFQVVKSDAIRAQQDAFRVENRFNEVIEHCGSAVLTVDRSLIVTLCNQTAKEILGHNPMSRPLIQSILSDELQAAVRRTLEDGKPSKLELREIGAEKRTLIADIFARIESAEAMIFIQDISEVRRLETVRRDFVANVSHELRTPLASIRAMAETLESGALEDKKTAQRFLGTIISESDRLARIAEDLLTLSRAESIEPMRERFDLSRLLDEVLARFSATAKKQKVSLKARVQRDLELVASREQVQEAVSNLVDNALKYTGEGGKVEVHAEKSDDMLSISVSDNGIGILQEDIDRIFERFYRVDKARSRLTGGTGLGLSIVKHVAEAHGGKVEVESEFNRGSTFTLMLPLSLPDSEDGPPSEANS